MSKRRIVIAGGGAAGVFAAIACAEARREHHVLVLEKSERVLSKVRISGGGRCNVTHACFELQTLSGYYPRGGKALLGVFHRFQPRDTVEWFEARGVRLKTERDGRIFPVTDSSQTIIDCLLKAARDCGVEILLNSELTQVARRNPAGFDLVIGGREKLECDELMLATGGCRAISACQVARTVGHTIQPPVPSLFSFHIDAPWLAALSGVSLEEIEVSVPGEKLREKGAVVITHTGLSGPAILKTSAWGARQLYDRAYKFGVRIHWLPRMEADGIARELGSRRVGQAARLVVNSPLPPIPGRLWETLVRQAGIPRETRWATLSHSGSHRLLQQLMATDLEVTGKSLNKEEFVTCGGVRLGEVNFKTMESRICPGLFFGGELLDIDGLTGGFNFQAAWTTGWIAGNAMADRSPASRNT